MNTLRAICLICLLSLTFSYNCSSPPQRSSEDQLRNYLEKAEFFFDNENVDSSAYYINLCLEIDEGYAPAYHILGKIFLYKDGIYNRRLSAKSLKKAIMQDQNNPEYHYSLGLTLEKQGFYGNALDEYEKAAEYDSTDPRPFMKIAELNKRIGLRYDEKKYFLKSVNASRKAAELNNDPESFYQQAVSYYTIAEYDSAISIINKNISHCQSDSVKKKMLLLLGSAFVESGEFDSAYISFNDAQRYMSAFEKDDINDPKFIMTPEQYDQWLNQSRYMREKSLKTYLEALDPNPTTEINERILEHYARIIYSQITFSIPDKKVDGSKSRRGEIYIRYGPPSSKFYDIGEGIQPSRWIWNYDQFAVPITLIFEDTFLDGDFDYPYPDKNWTMADYENDPSRIASELADAVPQSFDYSTGTGLLEYSYMPRQFKGLKGKTDLAIFLTIPYSQIEFERQDDKASCIVEWRQVLKYPSRRIADSTQVIKIYEIMASQINNPNLSIADDLTLSAFPESLLFAISIKDKLSNRIGIDTRAIVLRDFNTGKVELSDLILARRIDEPYDKERHGRKDIRILSNLNNQYFVFEPIWLYYEIYNLQKGPDGMTSYLIRQTIAERKSGGLISGLKDAITGRDFFEVVTTYDGGSVYSDENRIATLRLDDFEPGEYSLIIEIEDKLSGDTASISQDFVLYR